jgi:hydrogenase nickel incorporation protein HypA/HybF
MHEMSIAANIIQIAESQAIEAGAHVVNRIEIEVGRLAGVEIASLEFCFTTVRRSSKVTVDSTLVIHTVAGRGRCPECREEFSVDFFVAVCPECGAGGAEILQGRELKVRSINVD